MTFWKASFLFFTLCLILFSGCVSKRLTKKANAMDQAGMYTEASSLYLQALQSNRNNLDAKVGLSRTGQLVLNQKLDVFKKQYDSNNTKEALYSFQDCLNYTKAARNVGVELYLPAEYNQYYQEVEERYLSSKYKEGMKFLDVEDFVNGAQVFGEITSINGNYKDSKSQLITAVYEPKFRTAVAQLNNNRPRTAYYDFDAIDKAVGSYKNSNILKQDALDKATITISVSNFKTSRNLFDIQSLIKIKSEDKISSLKLPFYKIVANNEAPLPTRKVGWGISSQNPASSSVESVASTESAIIPVGVSVQLVGSITNFVAPDNSILKKKKRAYLASQTTVYDTLTKTRVPKTIYSKIEYTEIEEKATTSATVSFSLIETSAKRILVSDVIQESVESNIKYSDFDGDEQQLVPGYWESKTVNSQADRVTENKAEIATFRSTFKAPQSSFNGKQMVVLLADQIAIKIAAKIEKYNPEP